MIRIVFYENAARAYIILRVKLDASLSIYMHIKNNIVCNNDNI